MINPAIFKAYDIRGKYPNEINEESVAEVVSILAKHFRKGTVVVGHDARLSSPSLYKIVIKTLVAIDHSLVVVKTGMITTPMLYFLVNKLKAVGGIMVTASHNPKEYNGLKVVSPKGEIMSGKEIYELLKTLR